LKRRDKMRPEIKILSKEVKHLTNAVLNMIEAYREGLQGDLSKYEAHPRDKALRMIERHIANLPLMMEAVMNIEDSRAKGDTVQDWFAIDSPQGPMNMVYDYIHKICSQDPVMRILDIMAKLYILKTAMGMGPNGLLELMGGLHESLLSSSNTVCGWGKVLEVQEEHNEKKTRRRSDKGRPVSGQKAEENSDSKGNGKEESDQPG